MPRINFLGAVHHVMGRGVDGRPIFEGESDFAEFLSHLRREILRAGAELISYCLMTNHYHFAIKQGVVPLTTIMHRLLTQYSMSFNQRNSRQGYLFQGRYRAKLCDNDAYLTALIRYIHMNPVEAGLVSQPGDWPWSSYHEYLATGRDPLVVAEGDIPNFDLFVLGKRDRKRTPSLVRPPSIERESLEALLEDEIARAEVSRDALLTPAHKDELARLRAAVIHRAFAAGYCGSEIARLLGISQARVSVVLRG